MRKVVDISMRSVLILAIISAGMCLLTMGCGGKSGPPLYEISGKATFGGKPIPAGSILFIPDAKSENKGPQGIAVIKDGEYRTLAEQGAVAGSQTVQIAGYNGICPPGWSGSRHGAPIFPLYTTKIDLPAEPKTLDFDVPVKR